LNISLAEVSCGSHSTHSWAGSELHPGNDHVVYGHERANFCCHRKYATKPLHTPHGTWFGKRCATPWRRRSGGKGSTYY
jgi:hypothetical protein